MKSQKTGNIKRVLTLRFDESELKMLDEVVKMNKKKFNIKRLDRTKMIKALILKNYIRFMDKRYQEQEQAFKEFINAVGKLQKTVKEQVKTINERKEITK